MAGRFTIEAVVKAVDRVSRPVSRMANSFNKATRRMGRGVDKLNRKMRSIGTTAKSAFGVAGIAGAVAIAGLAIKSVIDTGADFEQSLVEAGARFGGIERGTAAFEALDKAARQVGSTTEFTSVQAAQGLDFFARAGVKAVDAVKLLPIAVDLATASGMDLARVTDVSTDALTAFGLNAGTAAENAKNFSKLADSMALATNSTNINMEQLSETLKEAAPLAAQAGISYNELIGLTGKLGDAGIKGTKAGTQLKNMFAKFVDPKNASKFRELGVDVTDAGGEFRKLPDVFKDLNKALSGMPKPKALGVLFNIFGLRGTVGASILGNFADGAAELTSELIGAEGAAARLATTMRDTTRRAIDILGSAFADLRIEIFKANQPGFEDMIKNLTETVKGVTEWVKENPKVAKMLGLFVALAATFAVVALVAAAIAAAIGFVAGSTVALATAAIVATAAFLAWLLPLNEIKDWFVSFFAADFAGKLGMLGNKFVEMFNPFTGGIAGFVGRNLFGGSEEPPASSGSLEAGGGVLSPEGRLARTLVETRATSDGTLTIQDKTGRAELDTGGLVTPFRLELEPSGSF